MITRAQQHRNATATRLDSSDFFVRRLEEYERTLSVLTTRIEESYTHKKLLNRLLTPVTWHLERAERDMDWFEESATQPIKITRKGEVERPRLALTHKQLENLRGTVVLQLLHDIVARSRCKVTGIRNRLSKFLARMILR